jgi:hypothetical protein
MNIYVTKHIFLQRPNEGGFQATLPDMNTNNFKLFVLHELRMLVPFAAVKVQKQPARRAECGRGRMKSEADPGIPGRCRCRDGGLTRGWTAFEPVSIECTGTVILAPYSPSRSIFLLEHDLFGKPVPTFPDHALGIAERTPGGRTMCTQSTLRSCDHSMPLSGGIFSRLAQEQRQSDSNNNGHIPEAGSLLEVCEMVTGRGQ